MFQPPPQGQKLFIFSANPVYTQAVLNYKFNEETEWRKQKMDRCDAYYLTNIEVPPLKATITHYYELYKRESNDPILIPLNPKPQMNENIFFPGIMLGNQIELIEIPAPEFREMEAEYGIITQIFSNPRYQGRSDLMIATLRAFVAKYPQSLTGWLTLGKAEFLWRNEIDAYNSLIAAKKIVEQIPENIVSTQCHSLRETYSLIYMQLGDIEQNLGNYANARQFQEKAVKLCPDLYVVWISLGDCARHFEKYEDARKIYQEALQIRPNNPLIYEMLAELAVQLEKWDEANQNYQNILDIYEKVHKVPKPWNRDRLLTVPRIEGQQIIRDITEAYVGLASVAIKSGEKQVAQNLIQTAKMCDSESPFIKRVEAEYEMKYGSLEEAVKLLEKAVGDLPKNAKTWLLLGQCFVNLGIFEKSQPCFLKSMSLGAIFESLQYIQFGWQKNSAEFKVPTSFEMIKTKAGSAYEWESIGGFFHNLHLFEYANECFKRITNLEQLSGKDFIGAMANVASKAHDFQRAIELDKIVLNTPEISQKLIGDGLSMEDAALQDLAGIYLKLNEFDRAEEYFRPLLERKVKLDDLYYVYGRFKYLQNNFNEALIYLRQVSPNSQFKQRIDHYYIRISELASLGFMKLVLEDIY